MTMDRKTGAALCFCRKCPSFVDCTEEVAYCLAVTGKSRCIQKERGCLCPPCPVRQREKFAHFYYCTRGTETDQISGQK